MICTYPNMCKHYVEITKPIDGKDKPCMFCDKKAQYIKSYVDECEHFSALELQAKLGSKSKKK